MRWLLISMICMTFYACNDHVLFQERKEIPDMIWNYSNPLEFSTQIAETDRLFDIYLDIEHTRDFSYGNLYTGLSVVSPGGDTTFTRISIDLADKMGQWLGTCKGTECSSQFLIADSYNFGKAGNNLLILEQYSREEDLQGIKSIELTIQAKDE
jgi:gliding motility-associated lipoprotein GldH